MTALIRTWAVALHGVSGTIIEVEAHQSNSLPGIVIIGLPDAALNEARERIRSAAANSGCGLPARKLTMNLSPAELPKHGAGFDLALALAALGCDGTVDPASLHRCVHIGELGLDGRVRPVRGVLPAVLAAQRAGFDTVLVPVGNQAEAELVPGIRIVPVASLRHAARFHGADLLDERVEPVLLAAPEPAADNGDPDLADIAGNADAVLALQAAAAGGHHMFLLGPPGAGKTMLAERLPGILPDLDPDASLEASCVRSLSGDRALTALVTRPPFVAPHHTATQAALVGGGSGRVQPGAVARASHGVLFLDEAPEFPRSVLDALRQPMERGSITIHRARSQATYPAKFQLVLAANPCPCAKDERDCECPVAVRRRYLGRLSGPLLDRVDLQLRLRRVALHELQAHQSGGVTSAEAKARVAAARAAASERFGTQGWTRNSEVPGSALRSQWRLAASATGALDRALERGVLTLRGYDRVLRVAWSLADLAGKTSPDRADIGQALYLRGVGA